MWNSASKLVVAIGVCLTIGFSWGCMGTPAYRMWYRSQWMEDEQARPSLHARLEELEALRSRAGSMSEAEQAQIAANLSRSLADDPTPLYRAHVVRTLGELSTPAATEAPAGYRAAQARNYATQVRVVNGRAFYQNGELWTDSTAQSDAKLKNRQVKFGSSEYFALLARYPRAAAWFSLGQNIDVVVDDTLYQVRE